VGGDPLRRPWGPDRSSASYHIWKLASQKALLPIRCFEAVTLVGSRKEVSGLACCRGLIPFSGSHQFEVETNVGSRLAV
jgi:hypothetical protein